MLWALMTRFWRTLGRVQYASPLRFRGALPRSLDHFRFQIKYVLFGCNCMQASFQILKGALNMPERIRGELEPGSALKRFSLPHRAGCSPAQWFRSAPVSAATVDFCARIPRDPGVRH